MNHEVQRVFDGKSGVRFNPIGDHSGTSSAPGSRSKDAHPFSGCVRQRQHAGLSQTASVPEESTPANQRHHQHGRRSFGWGLK